LDLLAVAVVLLVVFCVFVISCFLLSHRGKF
jgi:hypothetical protein